MHIRIPAIILVRAGSKRLKDKWQLPWRGTTLLGHAINQVWSCEYVSRVIVGSDSQKILDHAKLIDGRTETVLRDEVEDDQPSLEGLRQVQIRARLEASYVMLVQATSTHVNAADLERLVLCSDLPCKQVTFLGKKGKPSGQAFIYPPFLTTDNRGPYVEQDAPSFDIDTRENYEEALAWEAKHGSQ